MRVSRSKINVGQKVQLNQRRDVEYLNQLKLISLHLGKKFKPFFPLKYVIASDEKFQKKARNFISPIWCM